MKEKLIQDQLVHYLTYQGLHAFATNAGKIKTMSGGMFSGVPSGTSDIIGLTPSDGRFVAIEVKTPKTKTRVTELQQYFLDTVHEMGGIAGVAWDIESLTDVFKKYGYEFTN